MAWLATRPRFGPFAWRGRPGIQGYTVALLTVGIAFVIVSVFDTVPRVGTFTLAVIVSAWFGGTRPGILAIVLGFAVLVAHIELPHAGRFAYFVLITSFIVWAIASARRAAESLWRARDELQRQNDALNVEKVEAKALEELLRRSEHELREVIETIPAIAWTGTPDGRNDFINRSWEEYTGLSKAETAGDGWKRAVHPDDIAGHVEKWARSVASGEAFENEARYRRGSDGEYRWFLVRAVPLRDEAGRVSRWYGILADIQDRKAAEQAVRESARRLQHLSRRLLEVQEEERRNLARELHDEFGQLIATANLHLHAARSGAGEAARAGLDSCAAILQQAGDHVRSLALKLRPAMLETLGLDATLRWLARQQQERTGITTEVVGSVDEAAGDRAVACFRVAQEALTNVVKHARARHGWIEVGERDGRLELAVRDDGAGFDAAKTLEQAAARGQLGLLGMRERVQILGGDLRIDSQPGRGTHIRVSFPRT